MPRRDDVIAEAVRLLYEEGPTGTRVGVVTSDELRAPPNRSRRDEIIEVVDRWQFVDGPLGETVRTLVDDACQTIAVLLEHRWRRETGWDGPLDDGAVRLQLAHARSFQADGHTVARVVRTTDDPACQEALTTVLTSRILGGWHAYVADMQRHTGIQPSVGIAGISGA